ncbi:hypothetical protein CCR80_12185 [Rhodothalassium salexigens]|uniref:protease modulator HflC n=1 Tax=Rhodothalassium salexigens TaxID=1086 RepID=UPI001911D736|nr:protease modulator HflC [Rhodothalassium salexigens]MBK5921792.1 hypothetical protein [Rhodothalassium salexigens]
MKARSVVLAILGLVAAVGGLMSVYTVHETEQVIVLEFSRPVKAVQEPGLHFKMPWRTVLRLDNRLLNLDMEPEEVTASDQKRLVVDAFARFRIVDPTQMYRSIRTVTAARDQITKQLRSNLREVLGERTLDTLLSDARDDLMKRIEASVDSQTRDKYGIEIVDVRIRRADLPPANTQAILRRMEAERKRDAQKARSEGQEQKLRIEAEADRKATILIAEAEKESAQMRGQGDKEATRIFAEAFSKDEDFFSFYRSMQAYRRTLKKEDTTLVLSPDNPFFDMFMGKLSGEKMDGKN